MDDSCDPSEIEIPPQVLACVPPEMALRDQVLPIRFEGKKLVVAVGDPMDFELHDKIRFVSNYEIRVVTAPWDSLCVALLRNYGKH